MLRTQNCENFLEYLIIFLKILFVCVWCVCVWCVCVYIHNAKCHLLQLTSLFPVFTNFLSSPKPWNSVVWKSKMYTSRAIFSYARNFATQLLHLAATHFLQHTSYQKLSLIFLFHCLRTSSRLVWGAIYPHDRQYELWHRAFCSVYLSLFST